MPPLTSAEALDSPRDRRAPRAFILRLAIAAGCALLGGALAYAFAARPGFVGDHLAWWYGARVLLAGGNPYATLPSAPPYNIADPLVYPLTSLVAAVPFTPFPLALSHALFVAVGSALMAWGLAGRARYMLLAFTSFPFLMAANLGQWSPYIVAAILVPSLGWMVALKPNLGIGAIAWRPSRWLIVGGAAFAALTLLVRPSWPMEWITSVRSGHAYPSPLRTALGIPILLALLRWRSADARFVLVMSVLPQTSMFADQLPLLLIARTRKEMLTLVLASFAGGLLFTLRLKSATDPAPLVGLPYVTVAMYWCAVAVILARRAEPHEGITPSRAASSAASPTTRDYADTA